MLGLLPSVLGGKVRKTVRDRTEDIFPLPNPLGFWPQDDSCFQAWTEGIIRSVNWMAGVGLVPQKSPTREQGILLHEMKHNLQLMELWQLTDVAELDPVTLFNHKQVNGYGEEIHVAQTVRWVNVSESLPKAGGQGSSPQPMSAREALGSISFTQRSG